MAELPQAWRIYAQLQSTLSRSCCVNNDSWGIEAGLDIILASPPEISDPTHEDIARVISSKRKREHRRSGLRLRYLRPDDDRPDPEQALLARSELRHVRSQICDSDWELLRLAALGDDYAELAKKADTSVGAARIRVLRLRRQLVLKAA